MKRAFGRSTEGNGILGARRVASPADCLFIAAAISLFTAFGIATWLGPAAYTGGEIARPISALARNNLVGMSIGLAAHGLVLGLAALAMRKLRARLFALVAVTLAGLFFPLVVALNVILEFQHIPQWPAAIPVWLGMPAALWAVMTLLRGDVREAFSSCAVSKEADGRAPPMPAERPQQPASISAGGASGRPRISQWVGIAGFALMLMSAMAFVAGSPTVDVLPRNEANFYGIALACVAMLVWIIAAVLGQNEETSSAESIPNRPEVQPAGGKLAVEPLQDRSGRRIRLSCSSALIVAAASWLATIGEIVFLISQEYRNTNLPEFQLGMTSFLAVVAYALIIFAALQGRWLASRRTAIAGSVLLIALGCAHAILFAMERHRGLLSPYSPEWFHLCSRLRLVTAVDALAVAFGCLNLGILLRRDSDERFRAAALNRKPNRRRLAKALGTIGVGAAASWIALAVSMDWRQAAPPGDPEENQVVVFRDGAPIVTPYGIEILQLAPWQVQAMNEVWRGYYRQYVELEQKYLKRHVVMENRQVRANIYPFAADRRRLVDGFGKQLTAFLSENQAPDQRLGTSNHRWHFYHVLEQALFPFGQQRVSIDIRYDGSSFHCQKETDSGHDAQSYRELSIAYQRLWEGSATPPAREATYFLTGHGDAACALVATPDGKRLISAGTDGRIIIRPLDNLLTNVQTVIPQLERKYLCLAAGQKSDFVLAGGTEGSIVKVWLDDGRQEPLPLDMKGTITNLFLTDNDATLFCVENLETIHFVDLAEHRVRFTAPVFVGSGAVAKEGVWNSFAFAAASNPGRLATATQIRASNEGPADFHFGVLDASGTTVLIESELAAGPQDLGMFVRQPEALPAFSNGNSLRLYLPGSVRTWSYSNENKVWLDEGSGIFPWISVRDWTGPLLGDGRRLWARYDDLLMTFHADSGEVEQALLFDKREWTIVGGPVDKGHSLVSITAIVPIPQTNRVAVALWDGRLAVATLQGEPN